MPSFPSKTDAFFYDAYTRAWTGACVEEMVPIYQAEMESLLAAFEKGDSYRQEFAKDIPAVYKILEEGSRKAEAKAAQTLAEMKRAMKINYFEDRELIEEQAKRFGGES